MELKGGSEYQEGSSPVLSPSRTAHLSVVRSGGYGVWNRVVPAIQCWKNSCAALELEGMRGEALIV